MCTGEDIRSPHCRHKVHPELSGRLWGRYQHSLATINLSETLTCWRFCWHKIHPELSGRLWGRYRHSLATINLSETLTCWHFCWDSLHPEFSSHHRKLLQHSEANQAQGHCKAGQLGGGVTSLLHTLAPWNNQIKANPCLSRNISGFWIVASDFTTSLTWV